MLMLMNFLCKTKQILAGSLMVWLSGVVFLFCCQTMTVHASRVENCPMPKTSHCHKSPDKNDSQSVSIESEQTAIEFCSAPFQVFDKARKLEINQQTAEVTAKIVIPTPKFSFVKSVSHSSNFYQPVIRNRGSTFLINCVFRI